MSSIRRLVVPSKSFLEACHRHRRSITTLPGPAMLTAPHRTRQAAASSTWHLPTRRATTTTTDEDDDPCPEWQNPLHHNNPEFQKILAEDFEPGEEMPLVPLPPLSSSSVDAPPHIHALADEIIHLNMIELKSLMDRIGDHFGFGDDDGGYGADDAAGEEGEGVEAAAAVEKTTWDLKLEGFDAKAKIKVIKEIRAVTGLGLKEAKELVEGAPTVIKKGIKKEEAEELKAKLEEAGATIEIS